jgi:hypothetical protein
MVKEALKILQRSTGTENMETYKNNDEEIALNLIYIYFNS